MTNWLSGKTVLLTGAGGSIGSAMAHAIRELDPERLILLDLSGESLKKLDFGLRVSKRSLRYELTIGDVCDREFVSELFERHHPQVVYHAAALKHVPLLEVNPFAAVHSNTIGTNLLAKIAHIYAVESFTLISTDKAANPRSIMGASKRMAEFAVNRWKGSSSKMRAIRLGNVMWSQGSVLPLFQKQISAGGPVTVTHPDVSRYFLTIRGAVNSILQVSQISAGSGLFVPYLGDPMNILHIAIGLIKENTSSHQQRISIQFTGLRPGDKMSEDLTSVSESLELVPGTSLFRINGPELKEEDFDRYIEQLSVCIERRDLAGMLDAVVTMVPEYEPSDSLLALAERSAA